MAEEDGATEGEKRGGGEGQERLVIHEKLGPGKTGDAREVGEVGEDGETGFVGTSTGAHAEV